MTAQPGRTPSGTGAGWLACLVLATFVIGTDDFIIAGVLPVLAADLGVGEATAGQLVTGFSLTYAVAALPLAVATARLPRKALVVGGLTVFAVLNLLAAAAPGFVALMTLRIVTAAVAASITPAVFAMAASMAAPGRSGRAIGAVASGLTVSLLVGVPLGTLISDAFGWRATFVAVALFAGAVVVASLRLLPRVPGAPELTVGEQLRTLRRPAVLLCVAGTTVGASCGLMIYTYIAPLTQDLTGAGGAALAFFIAVAGAAGAVGAYLGGQLNDRWGTDRALVATCAAMVSSAAILTAIGALGGGAAPVWLVVATLVLWGLGGWGFNPPMNARILRLAGDAGTQAVALNTSALYVGTALAGAIGGAALAHNGGPGVALAATAMGVAGLVVMVVSVRLFPLPRAEASAVGKGG
ncbi:MFS transporter [Spiractinospora alimapuensis]|uniref:MFS transporter n=1 Tax=Spiractinospora alimapuensis TaxID=2820884 RepID=UPI001F1B4699|nr:MFS transporter [Spiractinospora alimapuensis]QVQ52789.1 MFS transporter [Spiractinospora alimapuensis]